MAKRPRPIVETVSGEKWHRRFTANPGASKAVYNQDLGPTKPEEYKLEKFRDKQLFEEVLKSSLGGILMRTVCDVQADGYETELSDGTTARKLHKVVLMYSNNQTLNKGTFYAGETAVFVKKTTGKTRFLLNDISPVLQDVFVFLIDGDLYCADDLMHFEAV